MYVYRMCTYDSCFVPALHVQASYEYDYPYLYMNYDITCTPACELCIHVIYTDNKLEDSSASLCTEQDS